MEQKLAEALDLPPNLGALSQRKQGSTTLTYLEGHYVIQKMNELFGPDGWTREFVEDGLKLVSQSESDKGFTVAATCQYRITVNLRDGDPHHYIMVEDVGFGSGQNRKTPGDAIESAVKEAVTDALKRCCRSLGNALGNCLYDKTWLKANAGQEPQGNLDNNVI